MSRGRFRSQPTLQRSGGRGGASAIAGIALLALVAVGAGAFIGELARGPAPAPATSPGPTDAPAAIVASPTPPPTPAPPRATVAPPATVLEARAGSTPSPAPALGVKKTRSVRPSYKARPQTFAAAEPAATPQESWEQQRKDYERARAAYDEGERTAGFQWAQQNSIRTARYCRVAAQRTPAFVDGCLNYLAARRSGAAARPRDQG